jgi:manganese efflux pump family protein
MEVVSALLVGIALAMDSLSVSITAGSTMKNIKIYQVLLIAVYFGFFQWLMTFLGWYGGLFLNDIISNFDHWIAFGLLVFIGGKMIHESFKDENKKKFIFNHKILFILAIATSIDALGVGLSYAFLDKPILFTSVIIGIVAFLFSYLGVFLGKILHNVLQNKVEIVGGLILIGIGIKILIDHGAFS